MIKKNLLLVSPFPNDQDLYPHVKYLIDELSYYYEIDYLHCFVRGIEDDVKFITTQLQKKPFKVSSYKPFIYTVRNAIQIYKKCHYKTFDAILCIDNFTYILTSLILKQKPILWSHDFNGYDEESYNSAIFKSIYRLTRKFLSTNGKLVIQDQERLNFFLKTIKYENQPKNVFFLPISLPPVKSSQKSFAIESNIPTVMQIGYIADWRSSDQLIKLYQEEFEKFNLFFHGFILDEILEQINKAQILPLTCSLRVLPDKMPQLIQLCDIGFISYFADLNHFYIKNASGQLVEFIRCGKPIIVHGNNDLQPYVEKNNIGVSIKTFDEFMPAVHRIMKNYSEYSYNCISIFNEFYDIKRYIGKLFLFLNESRP